MYIHSEKDYIYIGRCLSCKPSYLQNIGTFQNIALHLFAQFIALWKSHPRVWTTTFVLLELHWASVYRFFPNLNSWYVLSTIVLLISVTRTCACVSRWAECNYLEHMFFPGMWHFLLLMNMFLWDYLVLDTFFPFLWIDKNIKWRDYDLEGFKKSLLYSITCL